jgi:hypothetical protein
MNKVILGIVLGGVLGVFDGLTALISAPETAPEIVGIVIGSTVKGLLAGLLIGAFSRKVHNLWPGLAFGVVVGAFLAWLVTLGGPYLWEIVIPGSIVGLIVGFAPQRFGAAGTGKAEAAAVLALLVLAPALPAAAAAEVDSAAAFDTLKGLAGRWTGTAAGEPGGEVVYEVVSGGHTVMERMFPGTEHEMISMYHLEDGALVMTHYCAGGNQPKLALVAVEDGALVFDFAGGSNVDPAQDDHIHGARIRVGEDGTLRESWTGWSGGAKNHDMVMQLTRDAE